MPAQRDVEMADLYKVPVELLRARIGIPKCLWEAPDDEVIVRTYLRVATVAGLENACGVAVPPSSSASSTSTAAPASTPTAVPTPPTLTPLRCYLVSYIPPEDAARIGVLVEDKGAGLRAFKIGNKSLLFDKETSHMQIRGQIVKLQEIRNSLKAPKDMIEKHKTEQDSTGDLGLQVGSNIYSLKVKYLLALIAEGKIETARSFLKGLDPLLYRLSFPELPGSPRGTDVEEMASLVDATSELLKLYPRSADDNSNLLGKQLLGVVSIADFYDKIKIPGDYKSFLEGVDLVIKDIDNTIEEYKKMDNLPSLIGVASPDFRKL